MEAGYHWRQGSLALTPYLGLDQTQLRTDGFREQSGSGFGLQVQSVQATRSQLLAGVRSGAGLACNGVVMVNGSRRCVRVV